MHAAGVRFTTLFILTHIKLFFIMFRTNCWTDVFVVRLLAHRGPGVASEISCSTVLLARRAHLVLFGSCGIYENKAGGHALGIDYFSLKVLT